MRAAYSRTAATAIGAASAGVQPKAPQEIAGKATEVASSPSVSSRQSPMAGGQQCPAAVGMLPVPGPDRVDDERGGQPPGAGRDRLARGQAAPVLRAPEEPALLEQVGTGRGVDRAVDSPAAQQGRVGGVHDHVDVRTR